MCSSTTIPPLNGKFRIFYKEYVAETQDELNFLRAVKKFLDDRWWAKNSPDTDGEEATTTKTDAGGATTTK